MHSHARVRGSVLLNGAAPSLCHPALVGYVPQDDGALLGWLTVRELLRFYAVWCGVLPLRLGVGVDATHHTTLHHAGDPRAAGALRGGR